MRASYIGIGIWSMTQILSYQSILTISIVQGFILLAILVYVPLLLYILNEEDIGAISIIAGVFAIFSFQFHQGLVASMLVIPWVIVGTYVFYLNPPTVALQPVSVLELSSRVFLIIGPLTLLVSRLGLQPLGFSNQLIELTAIHFHYAGIMIPLIVSQIYQIFPSPFMKTISYMISLGTPIVALGITFGKYIPPIGIFSVLLLTIPLIAASFLVLSSPFHYYLKIAHFLLIISLNFAIIYAIGVSFSLDTISIGEMIVTHGIINGLGFMPLSILGWAKMRSHSTGSN